MGWFLRKGLASTGSLSVRGLVEELAALPDWRAIDIRLGWSGQWYPAAELDRRLSIKSKRKAWLSFSAMFAIGLIAGVIVSGHVPLEKIAGEMNFENWVEFTEVNNSIARQRRDLADRLMEGRNSLPRKIDADTIRVGVEYTDPTLSYQNIVLLRTDDFASTTKADVARAVKTNVCTVEISRKFMAVGGTFNFSYTDKEAINIMNVAVSEKDCF